MRLDRVLHARGLARSRSHAQQLIAAGSVRVDGVVVSKAAADVAESAHLAVDARAAHYVSRAAHKLLGALDVCEPLGLTVRGVSALDAGASTGGFTQVLLERGAREVYSVDVGHGQLADEIASDPRVRSFEGVNVRDLTGDSPGAGVDLVVGDLSFISLTHLIDPLVTFASRAADFVLMVKPQFEVGRARLSGRGVVTDPKDRARAVRTVAEHIQERGLTIHAVSRSALPGPQGNIEYFVWASGSWQAREHQEAARPILEAAELDARITQEVNSQA